MKARPILFSGEMVRALMDGRKTQTRRIIKPQPDEYRCFVKTAGPYWRYTDREGIDPTSPMWKCPYGQPGDYLWVRETTQEDIVGSLSKTLYPANNITKGIDWWYSKRVCPSIHMPRWASRLTLKITDVRVERVQDINDNDVRAEGAPFEDTQLGNDYPATQDASWDTLQDWFADLWDSINGNWNENPWVWVICFEVIKANVDEVLKIERRKNND